MLLLDKIRSYFIKQSTRVKSALALIFDIAIYIFIFLIFQNLSEELFSQSFYNDIRIRDESYYFLAYCLLNTIFLTKYGYYNNKIKFINFDALLSSVSKSLLLVAFISLVFFFDKKYFSFYLLISLLNVVLIVFSARAILKYFLYNESKINRENVLIYGAGSAGVQLFDSIILGEKYRVIGFLDSSVDKIGRKIGNINVYNPENLESLVKDNNINLIFIAIPSESLNYRKKILKKIMKKGLNVRIKILPSTNTLINQNINFNLMNDIETEDIIGRREIFPIKELLKTNIENKIILVTGAAGSIGSELCKKILENNPKKILMTDSSEIGLFNLMSDLKDNSDNIEFLLGDLRDKVFIKNFLQKHSDIDIVFHVAAYKHVNILEENQFSGFYNNVIIIKNLIESLIVYSNIKKFVNVSTDKAVSPTTIMGLSKYFCELIVNEFSKKSNIEFSIVRFGNVLKSSGSVLTIFEKQIKDGGPVTVTDRNVKRYFMAVEEAVSLIIQSSSLGGKNRRFVLDMGVQLSIYEIAKKMIQLYGFSVKDNDNINGDIEIKITGLKKSEKLEEELFTELGKLLKTEHPMIWKIDDSLPELDLDNFFKLLNDNYYKNNINYLSELMVWSKSQ